MIAIPSAVPTRCAVPRMPLAVPASRRGTLASTKSWFGAIVMPLPRPATNSGATRYQPLTSGAVRCTTRTANPSPAMTSTQPVTRTIRPSRADSLSLRAAAIRLPSENGAMTSPVISALCPRPSCHRIDRVKNTLAKPAK